MLRTISILSSCGLIVVACQTKPVKNVNSWPLGMQKIVEPIKELTPYIYNRNAFHDKENEDAISKRIRNLKKVVHELPEKSAVKMFGKDPLLTTNLQNMKDDIQRAESSFQIGHTEYARSVLRGTLGHCFQCHSRTQDGPEYQYVMPQLKGVSMGVTERAEYYIATRQYDKGLQILSDYLQRPTSFYDNPYENTRALKKYLALMTRVKKAPSQALNTLSIYAERKKLPYYILNNIKEWEKDLKSWAAEKRQPQNSFTQAKKLIKKALKQQEFGLDSGYIHFLRASSLLHESLRSIKTPKSRAQAYQLLGISYENLENLGLWSLPENYFESCIRELPQTKIAQKCYKDFEKNVVLGFSGSSGIFLPEDEKKRLKKLKALAGF